MHRSENVKAKSKVREKRKKEGNPNHTKSRMDHQKVSTKSHRKIHAYSLI